MKSILWKHWNDCTFYLPFSLSLFSLCPFFWPRYVLKMHTAFFILSFFLSLTTCLISVSLCRYFWFKFLQLGVSEYFNERKSDKIAPSICALCVAIVCRLYSRTLTLLLIDFRLPCWFWFGRLLLFSRVYHSFKCKAIENEKEGEKYRAVCARVCACASLKWVHIRRWCR